VSDCCLTQTQQFFSCIMARTSCYSISDWYYFDSASSLKQQSADKHVLLRHVIMIPIDKQYLLLLLNTACLAEKQQILIL